MTMPLDDEPTVVNIQMPDTATVLTVEVPGIQGPPGVFRVGTVETGQPGSAAEIDMTTDPDGDDVVNFVIPRGEVGPTGPANSLNVGTVSTLAPGDNARVTITGTAPNQTINLFIPQGATGAAGHQGDQGIQGVKGDQGVQGPKGDPGQNGQDGKGISIAGQVATYANLPANLTAADSGKAYVVTADGKLYIWSGTGFPANGSGNNFVGPAGPSNNLAIGTVSTGDAGASAVASITGTSPNQTLNLTIPRGAVGAQGSPGPVNVLTIGSVTTAPAGSNALATITGNAPSQSLNLTLPAGPVGPPGSGVLLIGPSDTVPANTPANTVIFRPQVKIPSYSWGSGSSYPSAGVNVGDSYFHLGLGCLMGWDGTNWRQRERAEVTSDTMLNNISTSYSGALYAGFEAFQTTSQTFYRWDGQRWATLPNSTSLNDNWVMEVQQSAGQAIAPAKDVIQSYDTTITATSMVSTTDHAWFTFNAAGVYAISATTRYNTSAAAESYMAIHLNSVGPKIAAHGGMYNAGVITNHVSLAGRYFNAGDKVAVDVFQNTGTTLTTTTSTDAYSFCKLYIARIR